jgi:hypothetical protein
MTAVSDRKIVFLADCQAVALMRVYRDFVVPLTGDIVRCVAPGRASKADLESIAEADAVVSQIFNVEQNITTAHMRTGALKVEFPAIFVGFLWPFSGQAAHVRNTPTSCFVEGPYPSQLADTFLNKLIREGVEADDALQRYLDLDIVRVAHLDRLLELHLGAQAMRDERSGFAFSRIIETRLRNTQLFLTSSHPTLSLMLPLIKAVFERLGVPSSLVETVMGAQRATPFPQTSIPIHPSVIKHFGLRFVDEHSRYPFWPAVSAEGPFSFSEFMIRYMNYQ